MADRPFKIAILGAGFWAGFQISAWLEQPDVEIAGICDSDYAKAETTARRFGIKVVCHRAEELIRQVRPDAIDIITSPDSHSDYIALAAHHRIAVICQKPLALTLAAATAAVRLCQANNTTLLVHENWRWQAPIRALKVAIDNNVIGRIFRARIDFCTGFPVFDNQPFLRQAKSFILSDMGGHILDTARFLFGEASSLYCQTGKVHRDICGEDVASVMMGTGQATVVCNLSYAENAYEHDRFPETYAMVEGEHGSIELGPDYWLRVTTRDGTHARRVPPRRYAWVDPRYEVVQSSMVPCIANLLEGLRGRVPAETSGEDNLKTVSLVAAAYASAEIGQAIQLEQR